LLKGLEELVDDIDNRSMGTNSISSLYEYDQISSDDEFKNYDSEKDLDLIFPLQEEEQVNKFQCKQS